MVFKGGILLLLLIALLSAVFALPDTCGAQFQGDDFLGDFHGAHSYLSYNIDQRYMKEDYLSYQDRFCTKNGSGIIAQLTSSALKEDIVIEVSEGLVAVELLKNRDSKPECIFPLNKKVIDGSSYLFEIEMKKKELSMTLFSRYTKIYSLSVADIDECLEGNFSSFTFLEKGGHKVGSSPSERKEEQEAEEVHRGKPYLHYNFDGCIGDSVLNGIPVAKASTSSEKNDVDPTCSFRFGPECTDICATSYVLVEVNKCACPKESEIDDDFGLCVQSCNCITCQNGGTCSVTSETDTVCQCLRDYEGKYCENKVDHCRGFNCQNGGSCTEQPNGPFCTCLPNFTGIQCEVFVPPGDPCDEVLCENNATCESNNTTLDEKFFCSCLPGYSGKLCEFQQNNSGPKITDWMIAIIVVVAAAVVVLFTFIFVKIRSEMRNRQGRDEEPPPDTDR